jgi:hypothetical protein
VIVRPGIGEEIRITGQREKFTANNYRYDLDIVQLGHETAVPYRTSRGEMPIMLLEVSNGSPQELHIRKCFSFSMRGEQIISYETPSTPGSTFLRPLHDGTSA